MIPLALRPEPSDFDVRVRRPGNDFLRVNPNPTNKQSRKKNYWTRCLPELRTAYGCICAYSACWIPTRGTVDHYWPRSVRSDLAYEWNNFRLASELLNSHKGNSTSVADPMHIQPGWFALDFHSFYVVPGNGLPKEVRQLVSMTITTLRLNRDDTLVDQRFQIVAEYAKGDVSHQFLQRRYPFIAAELERQGLIQAIKGTFC